MRTRLSQFLEAVTVTAPSAIKELASKLAVYANDAAYESALGAGAEGDIYFNSTSQMIRLYKNAAWENFAADEIDYDNTTSGLSATTVQAAIDEVESILSAHIATTSAHGIAGGVVMGTEGSTLDTVNFGIADDASTGTDLNITPTKIMTRMTAVASGDTLAGITNTNTNFLTLINDSTFPLSILNDSTGEATPAYRILTGTGSNLSLAAGSSLLLKYDTTESRWRVIGGSGAGISDPMTTRGDLIYRNPSNTTARLATGLFGQLLGTDGTDTWWENPKEFNYIGNPDALHNDTDYITTSTAGTLTVAQTTTTSECPEDPLKATAWRISGSGLTAGDYIEFQAAKVIANSHGGRIGRGVLHVRDVTSGQLTAQAYNKTTSTYIGQSVALDTNQDYLFDVPLTAGDNIVIHVIAVGTSITAMSVSGVGIFFEAANTDGLTTLWSAYPSFTPAGFTLSSNTLEWRYNRGILEVRGTMTIATASGAIIAELPTPNGEVIKYGNSNTVTNIVGTAIRNSSTALTGLGLATNGDAFFEFSQDNGATDKTVAVNGNVVFVASDVIRVDLKAPVDIIDSTLTAIEANYQNARARFYRAAGGGYSSGTTFVFDTEDNTTYDSALGIVNSSGLFTVSASGTYDITCVLSANPAWAANSQMTLHVDRGSGLTQEPIITRPGAATFSLNGNASVKLAAGNSFAIRVNDTVTISQGQFLCYIIIERRPDRSGSITGFPTTDNADTTEQILVAKVRKTTTAIVANTGNYISGNLHIRRIDNVVTITSESILTHSSQTTATSAAGLLPTWARPTNTLRFFITDGREFFVNADGSISTTATVAVTNTALPVHASFLVYDDQ